jgi:hypothetical protein
MQWILENDVTDVLDDLTFTVEEEVFGQVAHHMTNRLLLLKILISGPKKRLRYL